MYTGWDVFSNQAELLCDLVLVSHHEHICRPTCAEAYTVPTQYLPKHLWVRSLWRICL